MPFTRFRSDGSVFLTSTVKLTTGDISLGPPSGPSDGDIWIATGVDSTGARWMFQYNSNSASSYKWEFIGGGMATAYIANDEQITANAGWSNPATAGPSFTCARAGDYEAIGSANMYNNSSNPVQLACGVATNGVAPGADAYGISGTGYGPGSGVTVNVQCKISGLSTSDILSLKYFAVASTNTATNVRGRRLMVRPVRVS